MKKNFLRIIISVLLVATVFGFSGFSDTAEAKKYKTYKPGEAIASYTLSKSSVKTIAKNVKTLNGKPRNYGTIVSAVFKSYAIPVGLALNLSIDAQKRNLSVFTKAAKQNKRVKVQIIAGITPNLNTTKYTIVK